MRPFHLFLTIVLLAACCVPAAGQRPTLPLSSLQSPNAEFENDPDPLSDFPENGLPPAGVVGANPSVESGAALAREVLKFDEGALPMLMAALQKGGFNIIDTNGKPLYLPRSGPGLDISFFDFEVAGMLRGVGMGVGSSLLKLTKLYAGDESNASHRELTRRMLSDIRGMKDSDDAHLKFLWGFMSEMSQAAPELGSLETGSPESINLNMIQASIIERLMLRDLLAKFEVLSGGNAEAARRLSRGGKPKAVFINASWGPRPVADCGIIDDIAELKKAFKTGSKAGETVKIYKDTLKDYNNVIDLQNSQEVKGSAVAGAALAWAKVLLAFMSVKAQFDLEQPMPLIRTKRSGFNVGQTRDLSVTFIMNFGKTQIINCVAKLVDTATGVDLGIPDGGPIADVPVSWEVLLKGKGIQRYTDVPVFVDARDRGDISRQKTDQTGRNFIKLTGKPQAEDLEGRPVVPVPKPVNLRVSMALEKMDASKDIPKIIKAGIGPVIDPVGIIELGADFIQKIPLKSFRVTVPVRDWQPCTADWAGAVYYQREFSQTITIKGNRLSNGNSTGDGIRQISRSDNATITLRPRSKSEIEANAEPKPAEYYVWGDHSDITNGKRDGDPCCGPLQGSYMESYRTGSTLKYSSVFQYPFTVDAQIRQRDHSLSFYLATPEFPALSRSFYEVDESNCPLDMTEASDDYKDVTHMLMGSLPIGRYGERYADETGEALVGSKTLTAPDGSTVTWKWELVRCGNRSS